MSIHSGLYDSYLRDGAFMPEATAAMAEAFESACCGLRAARTSNGRALVATLIIAAARRGETDPGRLRLEAIAGFPTARVRAQRRRVPPDRAPFRRPLLKTL